MPHLVAIGGVSMIIAQAGRTPDTEPWRGR
jgi:hypothetical protein